MCPIMKWQVQLATHGHMVLWYATDMLCANFPFFHTEY